MMEILGREMAATSSASLNRATSAGRLACHAASCAVTPYGWKGRPVMMGILHWKMAAILPAKWRMGGHAAPISMMQPIQPRCAHPFVVMARSEEPRHVMMAIWRKVMGVTKIAVWRQDGFAATRPLAQQVHDVPLASPLIGIQSVE